MAVTLLCAGELPRGEAARLTQAFVEARGAHAADRMLFSRSDQAGTDALPKTLIARDVATAAHAVEVVAGTHPLLASALDAALLDAGLAGVDADNKPDRLGFAASGAIAYWLDQGKQFPASAGAPHGMTFEFLCALEPPIALKGETGGVAVVTASAGEAAAEAVGVVARSAALAQLCASAISRAVSPPEGELSAEAVWDALGQGARVASALRAQGHLRGAAITLRGRGRIIGQIEGDRLLRFGVSSWR